MKRNILNKGIIFLIILTALGCKVKKPVPPVVIGPSQTQNTPTINKAEVLKSLTDKQLNYQTLSIKAKADLSINNNSNDVSMNIRMQKGKTIWISVTAIAGLEVARALITPDSIKILNRLESSYIRKPFSYVYQYANKQLDFNTLQNLFTGNAVTGTTSVNSTIEVNGGQTHLKGDLSGLVYSLVFNDSHNLIQTNLNDKAASQTLIVNYSEYKSLGTQEIPGAVSIKSTASGKNISIDLRYTSVGINESLEYPFTVPRRFSIKN
ncbi:DUF4292 domain-containing protein [Paradesertivirga mongoliensis]|uniref:DUF4292 domain-containing protein n=1 Tax=Paradesertivirga mongoliensis TaxID=2100740 RepID=A0ABW4ZIF0_9SPHI|nr:DUF4292 domain-containing protein [Pedobacter mongoliensis]